MHQEIENIDGFGQVALGQHADFFGDMRFGEEGGEAKGEGGEDEEGKGDLVEQVEDGLHGVSLGFFGEA